MPAAWLRDNCPCALCRDPVSGQRLLHITGIPADIAVAEVIASPDTVEVIFAPDGHRAVFDRGWLARHGTGRTPGDPGPTRRPRRTAGPARATSAPRTPSGCGPRPDVRTQHEQHTARAAQR
jgi:Gamma-butyrobetaine hydroxylase-like, N-terminal